MKHKLYVAIFLFSVCFLTACPAPESDHIIINDSKTILNVEYEYVTGKLAEDHTKLSEPAKIGFQQYGNGGSETQWTNLTAENEYQLENVGESSATDSNNRQRKQEIKKVKLKLLPGEILRVFVSSHMNIDLKNLKSLKLIGENGKFESEGDGFEQFSAYRPDRFFTDTNDYRIIYR